MLMDAGMKERASGLSSIIPDPTNLRDYKPQMNKYWIDAEMLMINVWMDDKWLEEGIKNPGLLPGYLLTPNFLISS